MVEHKMENFIREYPNHAPASFCDALIAYTNKLYNGDIRTERTAINAEGGKYDRSDFHYWMTEGTNPDLKHTLYNQWSKLAGTKYLEEFNQLAQQDYYMDAAKVQMTMPGQGFHRWHFDGAGFLTQGRSFVIITYLNDDFEGGETEFLYQGIRVKPEKGKTVIFPASYTHMHRGNPPIGGTKYIATTWANRLPRMCSESNDTEESGFIVPSEGMIRYYKKN